MFVFSSTNEAEKMNMGESRDRAQTSRRRFTRLTNAHSKKYANHVYALALYFMFYNFVRIHKSLRVTPAMAAGISDRVWSLEDIVAEIEARSPKPKRPETYRKRATLAGTGT